MKKRIKVLLMVITLLISTLLFTGRSEAIVMWMQCTDSSTTKISDEKDFQYYSSFAVVNNEANSDLRNLVYDSTGFYNSKNPTYIMNRAHNGGYSGDFCWYGTKYNSSDSDANGNFDECDKSSDIVSITELLNGVCPTYLVSTADGFLGIFSDTAGAIQKDMLVMAGKTSAPHVESLNESIFVIYKFKNSSDKSGIIIEGYNSSGLYGYATTWSDWNSFYKGLNMTYDNDSNDVISKDGYCKDYMSWTASTQARRIATFGRNYFKLLDDDRPWLVGGVSGQSFTVDESLVFKSNDSNHAFLNYVSEWYVEYEELLNEQLTAMEELQSSKYKKTFEVAEKIDDVVTEEKKYTFTEDYNASQMVIDLENAYNELKKILSSSDDGNLYNYYDNNCQLVTDNKTDDALASIHTKFMCDVFGKSSASDLPHTVNGGILNELVASALSNAIDEYSKSDLSIRTLQSTAQEYAKLLTTAIKYIKTYEVVTGDAEKIILTLEDDYTAMTREFGTEVIISCEDLINDDLREEIKSYLNIVKIAVPIILILFGIIEFTKAIFAGDEDQMKKAQKNFMIRLAIAVIFFLTPTIVDFLLGIANKVWNFIEPGSCGIF